MNSKHIKQGMVLWYEGIKVTILTKVQPDFTVGIGFTNEEEDIITITVFTDSLHETRELMKYHEEILREICVRTGDCGACAMDYRDGACQTECDPLSQLASSVLFLSEDGFSLELDIPGTAELSKRFHYYVEEDDSGTVSFSKF